ncbi:MAG TPA: type II toxin-antitoxin system RelE/ParE family toxin [Alphaproteobacteria bacterium]|jgi:toxin ParE1/3/4|nr:type II toxin-antitoxin system RelE/ParE family toxin [Alphaproteobacteria bacterium]|tara:strand:- start:276 stop:614 length:339 start_codon:yes stop_codon:yes gene_type:complete
MANEYVLTKPARADLKRIGQYTAEKWGIDQEKKYLTQLFERFDALAENPHLGRERPEIKPGYRSIVEGRHVIFYRVRGAKVEILNVLHGQMDLKRQLENPRRPRPRRGRGPE